MKRVELVSELKAFKTSQSANFGILTIGFFGSYARDEQTENSDVDIVVTTETPDPYMIVHLKEQLEKRLHCSVDIVRMRDKMNPFLKSRIEKEAVYV